MEMRSHVLKLMNSLRKSWPKLKKFMWTIIAVAFVAVAYHFGKYYYEEVYLDQWFDCEDFISYNKTYKFKSCKCTDDSTIPASHSILERTYDVNFDRNTVCIEYEEFTETGGYNIFRHPIMERKTYREVYDCTFSFRENRKQEIKEAVGYCIEHNANVTLQHVGRNYNLKIEHLDTQQTYEYSLYE